MPVALLAVKKASSYWKKLSVAVTGYDLEPQGGLLKMETPIEPAPLMTKMLKIALDACWTSISSIMQSFI
jgi:hypothetical protein